MGSSSKSSGDTEVRYAPYLESFHEDICYMSVAVKGAMWDNSPYRYYDDTFWGNTNSLQNAVDNAYFSAGYIITDFPSLWDMFGKYVAGLDIESLYDQIENSMVNSTAIDNAVIAEDAYLEDDLNQTAIPKINAGYRDIGAVMSSAFIYSKTLLQANKQKVIAKYDADLRMNAMNLAQNRYKLHLDWNQNVISLYSNLNKLYWATKFDWVQAKTEMDTKHYMWDYTILDHHRAIIGALNGAHAAAIKGQSWADKVLSGMSNISGALNAAGSIVSGFSGIASLLNGLGGTQQVFGGVI